MSYLIEGFDKQFNIYLREDYHLLREFEYDLLAKDHVQLRRTKHIDIKYYFFCTKERIQVKKNQHH